MLIAKNPPPTLKNPEKYPKELNDFIASMMIKDPATRPGAKELLSVNF